MSDEERKYHVVHNLDEAADVGIDAVHLFDHMIEAVLCTSGGDTRILNRGFFAQITDDSRRVWTLSVIPEDGGLIQEALLDELAGGDE